MNKKSLMIGLVVFIVAGVSLSYKDKDYSKGNDGQVACTMEAKLCPDGSSVGRTGPKCEFALCPTPIQTQNTTAKIGERILNNGIYITPLKVMEDSRCAVDVQCIWAGRLTVNTKLESADGKIVKELVFTVGNFQTAFAGKNITLGSVAPAPRSTQTIKTADYAFTFTVTNIADPHADLIKVSNPVANALVASPLSVTGQARGNWYFEASFPVHLYDANGKEIAVTPATAQGEWMTTNFVPFKATLTFAKPATATGTLVLEKDNASGLPEHDDKIVVPVRF